MKTLKILHFPEPLDGCTWYRQSVWLRLARGMPEVQVREISERAPDGELTQLVRDADVLLARGFGEAIARGLIYAKRLNPKLAVVFDTDDDLFEVSPLSGAFPAVGQYEVSLPDGSMLHQHGNKGFNLYENWHRLVDYRWCLREADVVTTTTERLAKRLRHDTDRVEVVPNAVMPEFFPVIDHPDDGLIHLVWAGGSSHFEDLKMIQPSLQRVMEQHKHVHMHFVGQRFNGVIKALPEGQTHFHDWVNPDGHGFHLATIPGDIGLCPLENKPFNHAKSCIKFYEYAALGWATIASDTPPYSDEMTATTGRLVNPNGWEAALTDLINDPKKRGKLSANARQWVLKERNAHSLVNRWLDVLRDAVASKEVHA